MIPRIIASSQDTNCKRPVQVRLGANLCLRGELFIDCTQNLSTLEHSGNRLRETKCVVRRKLEHARKHLNFHACCYCLVLAEIEMNIFTFKKSIN